MGARWPRRSGTTRSDRPSERYHARQSTYADKLTELDIQLTSPKDFSVGIPTAGSTGDIQDSWTLTLTRSGKSAGYGEYTVTFTEQGYDSENSTIAQISMLLARSCLRLWCRQKKRRP